MYNQIKIKIIMKKTMKFRKLTNFLLAMVVLFAACKKEEEPAPFPVANFTYEANELEVTFTNVSQNSVSYAWDFGNGEVSSEKDPVVTYAEDGEYKVVLTATNVDGETHAKEKMISVTKIDPCIAWDGSQANNLIVGGGFEICDTKYWSMIKAGEPENVKYEFGYTDYKPTQGTDGALYIFPDNTATSDGESTFFYQKVTVTDGEYEIGALIKLLGENKDDPSSAMTEYWLEFYVGKTVPVDGEDYKDGKVSGWYYGGWTGWQVVIPATDGPLVHDYIPSNLADANGHFNLEDGDYYVGIKVGKGGAGSFGDGIATDNFNLKRIGDRNPCFDWDGAQEGNLVKGGQFGECDDKYWTVLGVNLEAFPVEFGYTAYAPATGDGKALYFKNTAATDKAPGVGSAGTIYQWIGTLEPGTYNISAQVKTGGVDGGNHQFWWEMYVWTEKPVEGQEYQPKESDADGALKVRPIAGYTHPGWGSRSDLGGGTATVAHDGEMQYAYNLYDLADENGNFVIETAGDYFFTFKFGTWEGSFGEGIAIDNLKITKVE